MTGNPFLKTDFPLVIRLPVFEISRLQLAGRRDCESGKGWKKNAQTDIS